MIRVHPGRGCSVSHRIFRRNGFPPGLSAKLHLDLALGDSGNRDGDGDHVGGAFPASNYKAFRHRSVQ
jgi:hypothetical protein